MREGMDIVAGKQSLKESAELGKVQLKKAKDPSCNGCKSYTCVVCYPENNSSFDNTEGSYSPVAEENVLENPLALVGALAGGALSGAGSLVGGAVHGAAKAAGGVVKGAASLAGDTISAVGDLANGDDEELEEADDDDFDLELDSEEDEIEFGKTPTVADDDEDED